MGGRYWFGGESHLRSQFGIQSHHTLLSIWAFRAITPSFSLGFQSCRFSLAFRATVSGRHLELSHCLLSIWRSEPSFSFGVQSHYRFSVLTFRAITIFSLAFRVVITFQFGVQSHHRLFSLAFRAIITSQFGGSNPMS